VPGQQSPGENEQHDGSDARHGRQQPRPRAVMAPPASKRSNSRRSATANRPRDRLKARIPGSEFANPPFETRQSGWLNPEATQNAPQAHSQDAQTAAGTSTAAASIWRHAPVDHSKD